MAGTLDGVAERICERYLKPYLVRVRNNGLIRLGPKQVHDPIWGTISLRPLEVALLDSPLLQRLRHLKQLGVAHWVYPGADHSRFEHTLGVLYQTQQLISAINRVDVTKYVEQVISEDDLQMLRIAALMHDIGHPVLSHVSEYALRLDPKILLEVQRERRAVGEKATVSELVAAKIVRSQSFEELLRVIGIEHGKANLAMTNWVTDPKGFADRVAKTILGQNVASRIPLMHEIISGPYDADKLDYMVRDPKAAGIPATIDISRLVQKLTVERISSRALPEAVARLVPQGTREAYLFGFPWSGLSVVDELLLARMMLYAKLYRHPKVAGLEAIVQSLLDQVNVLVGSEKVVEFIYSVLDDQLVLAERRDLLDRLGLVEADVTSAQKARALEVAVDLLRRLRERELFVRAFAFFPGQPETDKDITSSAYDRIIKHIDDQTKRDAFQNSLVVQARVIMKLLGTADDSYFYRNLDQLLVLRRLLPPSQKELRHAWIFPTGGAPRTFEKTSIHKEAWSSSFVSASAKGYVFAPKELAQVALLATEAVISAEFGVGVPEWMMEETKQSVTSLLEMKLTLRHRGFYRDKPKIIRPKWPRLSMSDVEIIVSRFADKFSAVQETVTSAVPVEKEYQGASALKERAYSWLDQFETDADIDCALVLLDHARLISRQDVVGAVRTFITSNREFGSASVISLSKGNDSSQIVQYFAADVGGGLVFYGSLEGAVRAGRDAPVVVVDDFCGSGNQWANLIGALFGATELRQPELHEQRSLGLEPERDFLRNRKVAFIFTAGWSTGAAVVQAAAEKVGMEARVYVHLTESELPFTDSALEADHVREHAAAFLEKAGAVGKTLLDVNEPDWPSEKIEQRKLGYGNRGMLLFVPYNAPSQTMTCMWAEGDINGERWEPLIRRRKKI
jgi:HD superfamily phosphohydrolase